MLYHKFITLSISCIVQVRKLHNNAIHSLTRKRISYLSSMQSSQYQDNSNYSDTENDEMDKIPLSRDEYLNNTDPTFREKPIRNHSSLNKTDPYLIDDNKLTCRNKRNVSLYTMFNIVFNSTMFGTLDRQGFLPMRKIKKSRTTKLTFEDDDELFYVVKLEPKSNILSLFGGREQLIYFWHFVRHYLYKPSMKIIPTLEKIMPGFGLKLIEKDYNIFTQFDELSINQIIDIYMELRSYPGFNDSSFTVSGDDVRRIYDPFMEGKCN